MDRGNGDKFVAHAKAFDAELGAPHRSNLTAEARAKLESIETQIVAVTGWMVLTYPGPPESCNCGSAEFHDWHIELLPKPLDHAPRIGDPTAIIAEVTPRTEMALYKAGIHVQRLAEFMNQHRAACDWFQTAQGADYRLFNVGRPTYRSRQGRWPDH